MSTTASTITYRNFATEAERQQSDEYLLYLMSSLGMKKTGCPFIIWISLRGEYASPEARVWTSPVLMNAVPSTMTCVLIEPSVRVVEGDLSEEHLSMLTKWIEVNRDVLIRHWDGDLVSSMDAIGLLRAIVL